MSLRENQIEPFTYPLVEVEHRPSFMDCFGSSRPETGAGPAPVDSTQASMAAPMEAETGTAFAEGRAEGFRAGLEQGRAEGEARGIAEERARAASAQAAELQQRKRNAAAMVENFFHTQEQFQRQLESEAVRLSLAVAARILRREAQMDPLLLTGAVRVALGQLSESTKVELHVPGDDLALWRDAIEHLPNLPKRPVVVGDDSMELGECRIEAEMGSVDLGLKAQLVEIERGFFDRIGMEGRVTGDAERSGTRHSSPCTSTVEEAEYLNEGEPVR